MIRVTHEITLADQDVELDFTRSPGPGGQHVNTTDSAVQLRFDPVHCPALPAPVRVRLLALARGRVDREGALHITAHRHRSRQQNIEDAISRLCELIRAAAVPPKKRRSTTPTRAAKERRLEQKRRRSETKSRRQVPDD
ncbi:MAG: aminoacyl-tRNA hydrolase [Lentisphaeria bacterium]|nr:aminoacyl-tRNA hydrolase [Lentisphaeria bacterium]